MSQSPRWSTAWKVLKFLWAAIGSTTLKRLFANLIVTVTCENDLRYAAASYCWHHLQPSRRWRSAGAYTFAGNRKMPRVPAHYLIEEPGEVPFLFWKGWRPLWLVLPDDGARQQRLCIKFLRWTFNTETLLQEIISNARWKSTESQSRFSIIRGSGDRQENSQYTYGFPGEPDISLGFDRDPRWNRFVGWNPEDLDRRASNPLDRIILHPDVAAAVGRVRRWWKSRSLHAERGIPWTYGWLLVGPPGCGKSSLSIAIAEEMGVPLYSLDIGDMSASQLRGWFTKIRANTPAILLLEDLDRIYVRDKPAHEGIMLEFSALLNELSGIVSNDGIFVIVTANDVAKIDPALYDKDRGPDEFGRRLDRMVEMSPPGIEQRRELARRILVGEPEATIEEIVQAGSKDSFKEFTSRCSDRALRSLLD